MEVLVHLKNAFPRRNRKLSDHVKHQNFVQSMVCFWTLGLIGFFLSKKATSPRMRKWKRLEFQRIWTRMAAERGQYVGEHQRGNKWWARDNNKTTKKVPTIFWYKRLVLCSIMQYHAKNTQQKHATTFSRRHQPLQRTSTKISLQNKFQTRKHCSRTKLHHSVTIALNQTTA